MKDEGKKNRRRKVRKVKVRKNRLKDEGQSFLLENSKLAV